MALASQIPVMQVVQFLQENHLAEMWVDYDAEADTMYINFQRPVEADDSEMSDENTIVRYRDNQVVGLTILHASNQGGQDLTS
jgi:uncharacterized protein YuzE